MNQARICLAILLVQFFPFFVNAQLTYAELEVMYDSAWTYKNLQMIPIKFKPKSLGEIYQAQPLHRPISLSEALLKNKVKLTEMQYENGADVNLLQITNHSKHDVVVQGGDVLEGGKQDRMIGETKYISPGTTDYIKVYCIEKRRWSPKAKEFKHRGVANNEVQKAMNLKKRQSEVWKQIDREFKEAQKTSETWSYLELYNNDVVVDTGYINFFTKKYLDSDSNNGGFIFITDNKIMSTEIFSSNSLLDLTFANMLNSYVQSVIKNGGVPKVSKEVIKSFMNKVLTSVEEQKIYVTSHGKINTGTDGRIIHLIAYPD